MVEQGVVGSNFVRRWDGRRMYDYGSERRRDIVYITPSFLLHAGSWKVWGGGFESGDGEMGIGGGDIYAWVWERAERGEEGMGEFLENYGLIHILEATVWGGRQGEGKQEKI